jgi:hypothetical protein
MFEKIGRLAEGLATTVGTTRRGFLGRVGKSALGVAAALGALGVAAAQSGGVVCCKYHCGHLPYRHDKAASVCLAAGSTCAAFVNEGCQLVNSSTKSDCSKC